jgi:hypothetical protein
MITQAQFDELAEILFEIRHNCNGYVATDEKMRFDDVFVEQVRKLANDIELWCDDVKYRKK